MIKESSQASFVYLDIGLATGLTGTALQVTNDNWLSTFGHPNSALEGIIVSIYNLGAFSGCILTFIFGEKCGRRLCMWIGMFIYPNPVILGTIC
jgi:MFS family permease